MVKRNIHFDRRRLQSLLDDQLSEAKSREVVRHIGSCADCRRELERLAGEESWWREAQEFLGQYDSDSSYHRVSRPNGEPENSRSENVGQNADDPSIREQALAVLAPSENPALLGMLGDYEITDLLGQGGMGIVFKGFDRELNRYVAIKVLAPHYGCSAAARKRFGREAQAAAAIVHQHVVAIHAVDDTGKLPYLVMPYVAGETLQQRIDRLGPLDLKDILRIGLQISQGLAAAHAQGLIHRDIKPANILLEKTVDRVLLTDFGLARAIDDAQLTRSGVIAGTPRYMSPEQAQGESTDLRTDLFSLGSLLYAMGAGRPPFRAQTTMGVLRHICETTPRTVSEINPELPPWLSGIVEKLLSKKPADRFQSASEVAELLEKCLAHVQHPASVGLPASLQNKWLGRFVNRSARGVIAIGATILAAVGLLAMGFFGDTAKHGEVLPGKTLSEKTSPSPVENSAAADAAKTPTPDGHDIDQQLQQIAEEISQLERSVGFEFSPHKPAVSQSEKKE